VERQFLQTAIQEYVPIVKTILKPEVRILPFKSGASFAGLFSEENLPPPKSEDSVLQRLLCQAISNLMFEKGHNEPGLPSSGEQAETWSRR
jgi:hypothetical protein